MRVPVLVPEVEGNDPKADGIHRSDEDLTNNLPVVLQTNRPRTVFTNDLLFRLRSVDKAFESGHTQLVSCVDVLIPSNR